MIAHGTYWIGLHNLVWVGQQQLTSPCGGGNPAAVQALMLVDTSTVPVRHGWPGGFLENHVGGQMKLSPDAIKDGGGGSNRVDKLTET